MADASTSADTNTIQAEENALTQAAPSSSDKSLIPATPTPEPDQGTPTLPGDTGTEASGAPSGQATGTTTEPVTTPEGQPVGSDGKPSTPQWVQRRIDKLTAEKHEARREADAAKAQSAALLASLAELRASGVAGTPATDPTAGVGTPVTQTPVQTPAPAPAPTQPVIPMAEAEIEARAQAKAAEIARVNAFNKTCNDIADAGKTAYKDFDDALKNFNMQGGIPDQLLQTLVEMPNAHKVLYTVGKDPELIEKMIKLPPMKMAMELARLEQNVDKPAAPAPVSGAPRPITPIDAGARASEDAEKMSTAEWMQWREKNKKSRW